MLTYPLHILRQQRHGDNYAMKRTHLKQNMNPSETNNPDRVQVDVKGVDEDKKLPPGQIGGTNQGDRSLQEQLDNPFELVEGGNPPLPSHNLFRGRKRPGSSSGRGDVDTVINYELLAAYLEAKHGSSQQDSSTSDGKSPASSEQLHQGQQKHPDETQLSFPDVLMEILSNDATHDIASWLPHGKSFQILDKKRFEQDVLPVYFGKKSKYSSFTRKLHRWQFTRITRGPELGAYFHPLFQRSNPHLTLEMTCNAGRSNQQNETMNPEVLGMATPQMIRYGFASASSEPPTQMKTNGSEGSFQLQMSEPDFNFAGQASAAAASQQLPSQVISRELEALLQQSLQPRDTRAGSEALTAPLTPALRGVVSSSSSSSNSNISGMISDHHRIMLLQLELQNLQRQLDHERNPQQSMIPLSSLLSGTTSFPAMQNSTINGQSVTSPDTDTAATSRNGIPTMMGQDFNYASMVPTLMASTGGASANLVVPSQIFSDSRGNDLSMPHLSNSGQATTLTKNLDVNTVGDNSVFRWPPTGVVVPVSHTAQHNSHGDLFDDVHPIPIAEIAANQRFPPTSGSHNPQHLLQQPVQGQEEPSELFGDDRAYYSLSYRDDTYD